MSLLLLTVLVPLAFIVGLGASAIGMTAWMLMVPVLFVLFGFDLYLTIFISLSIDCGNALIMIIIAAQNRQLDVRQGLRLSLIAAVFAILGVFLGTTFIPQNEHLFKNPSAIVTLLFGMGFIRRGLKQGRRRAVPVDGSETSGVVKAEPTRRRWISRKTLIYPAVFAVSFQSGLVGVGGGMMYAVFLMFCLAYSTLKATGTAMLISLITTVVAASGIFFQISQTGGMGLKTVILILLLVLVSMLGTIFGARIAYSLSIRKLNFLIAGVIIFAALLAMGQSLFMRA
ncbi:sulfite exporter TauE/SafE family protein [bacterium]|nr:sulfite exporter TauE/SafE family protein [bacterium]